MRAMHFLLHREGRGLHPASSSQLCAPKGAPPAPIHGMVSAERIARSDNDSFSLCIGQRHVAHSKGHVF